LTAKIDWYYHRNNCTGCEKSQGFLAEHGHTPAEVVDARKTKYGPSEALTIARKSKRVLVAKGKGIISFDMTRPVKAPELVAAMLGPKGNLRAPSIRVGQTLIVGFNKQAYREAGL
jgi:arsenate reductase-like glutaredoxin family protein